MFRIVSIVFIIFISSAGNISAQPRIMTIGDSTMYDYDEERYSGSNEQRGWGQMLPAFLKEEVTLMNVSRAGRSSKSFYYEFWQELRETLKEGDYVFIQFGHNDEKNDGLDSEGKDKNSIGTAAWGEYQEYLKKYVDECRNKGAIPILFTPVVRADFDEQGRLTTKSLHNLSEICGNDSIMNYPLAMRSLAKEWDVPLIDMTDSTQKLVEAYGYEKAKKYIYCRKDNTHLKATGGLLFADLAVKELIRLELLNQVFIF